MITFEVTVKSCGKEIIQVIEAQTAKMARYSNRVDTCDFDLSIRD